MLDLCDEHSKHTQQIRKFIYRNFCYVFQFGQIFWLDKGETMRDETLLVNCWNAGILT